MVHTVFKSSGRVFVADPRDDTGKGFLEQNLAKCTPDEVKMCQEWLKNAAKKPLSIGSCVVIQGMEGVFKVTRRQKAYYVRPVPKGKEFSVADRDRISPVPVLSANPPGLPSTFEAVSTQPGPRPTTNSQVSASMASSAPEQEENTQSRMDTAAKGIKLKGGQQSQSQPRQKLPSTKKASSALAFPKNSWVMRKLSDETQMGPYRVHGFYQGKHVVIDPENDYSLRFKESELVQCGAAFQPPVPKVEPIPKDAKAQIKDSDTIYLVGGRHPSGAYRLCPYLGGTTIRRVRRDITCIVSIDS